MCINCYKLEKQAIDQLKDGLFKNALETLKKTEALAKSDGHLSPNSVYRILCSIYVYFEDLTASAPLLETTVSLIVNHYKALAKVPNSKSDSNIYKLLCNFLFKCEKKGQLKECLLLVRSCIAEAQTQQRLAGGTLDKDLRTAYSKLYMAFWSLAGSKDKLLDFPPSLVFRARLLALVLASKSGIGSAGFLKMLEYLLSCWKFSKGISERDLQTIEGTILSFQGREGEDSCPVDGISMATSYASWMADDLELEETRAALDRIRSFVSRLQERLMLIGGREDRLFCSSLVGVLMAAVGGSGRARPKVEMSPVDLFLSRTGDEEEEEKENSPLGSSSSFSTADALIDFVVDSSSQGKVSFSPDNSDVYGTVLTASVFERCLNSLRDISLTDKCSDRPNRKEVVFAVNDFVVEIFQRSPHKSSLVHLFYKSHSLCLGMLTGDKSGSISSRDSSLIYYWKKKLRTYLEMNPADQKLHRLDMESDLTEVTPIIASQSFKTSQGSIISVVGDCYRIARSHYRAEEFKEASHWFQCCVTLHKARPFSGEDDGSSSFKIWQCCEFLADCLKKMNRTQEALNVVVEGVLADPSSLDCAAKRWMKVMSGSKPISMADYLKEMVKDHKELSYKSLIVAELKVIKCCREKALLKDYHQSLFDKLLGNHCSDDLERAEFLLEKVKWIRSAITEGVEHHTRESLKVCQEAISLLHRYSSAEARDLKAQALVLSFACAEPASTDELDLEGQLKKLEILKFCEDNVNNNEAVVDGGTTSPPDPAEELRVRLESEGVSQVNLGPLEEALDLWCEVFSQPRETLSESDWGVKDVAATSQFVEIMAALLKLHQHPRQIVAFQLLCHISRARSDFATCVLSATSVADRLLDLGQHEAAERVLNETEGFVPGLGSREVEGEGDKNAPLLAELAAAKCRASFARSRFDRTATLLAEIGLLCNTSNRVDEISAKHCLYSTLCQLCHSCSSETRVREAMLAMATVVKDPTLARGQPGTQLEWSLKTIKCLNTLVPHLFSNCTMTGSRPSTKFLVVDKLIGSLLVASRCFVRCGLARECKTYLLHAMAFSCAFRLRRRICEIKLEFGRLADMCGHPYDSACHLSMVRFLLEDGHGKTPLQPPTPSIPAEIQTSAKTTDVASTPANYRLSKKSHYLKLGEAAPTPLSTFKKPAVQPDLPPCWRDLRQPPEALQKSRTTRGRTKEKAESEGKCDFCKDVSVRRLQLSCMIFDCEIKLRAKDQLPYVRKCLDEIDSLAERLAGWSKRELAETRFSSRMDDVFQLRTAENLFHGARVFEDLFDRLETLKLRLRWANDDGDNDDDISPRSESRLLSEVESLTPADLAANRKVEGLLMRVVSRVQWPDRLNRYPSERELLVAQVGRVITDDGFLASIASPARIKGPPVSPDKGPSIVNAPVKRGRKPPQPKVELADSPRNKRRPPPRLRELDPLFIERFEEALNLEPKSLSLGEEKTNPREILKKLLNLLKCDPPAALYRELCHSLAIMSLDDSSQDDAKAAYYFCEAMSISFRHSTLVNIGKKLRELESPTEKDSTPVADQIKAVETLRRVVDFKGPKDWSRVISNLPADWTVCQLNLVSLPGQDRSQLFVSRFSKNAPPVVVPLPPMKNAERRQLLERWDWLMAESGNTMKIKMKKDWWSERLKLDEGVKDWLEELEETWFSGYIGSLLGKLTNVGDEDNMKKAVNDFFKGCPVVDQKHKKMVEMLLHGAHLLDKRRAIQALAFISDPSTDRSLLKHYFPLIQSISKRYNFQVASRGPVILILDKDFQHFPIENLPGLEKQSFTRHVSFHSMLGIYCSITEGLNTAFLEGFDKRNAFYVLNPEDNLEFTQAMFEDWFQKEPGWEGVVGKPPTAEEISKSLSTKDLYIYCGHGCGSKFLKGEELQKLICRSVVMLIGCSSGRLWSHGQFEPSGMITNYMLAEAPCVMANLWDVTDKDIDRYVKSLLTGWCPSSSPTDRDFVLNAVESRSACSLRYLIGAAPVVYGFPVQLRKPQ